MVNLIIPWLNNINVENVFISSITRNWMILFPALTSMAIVGLLSLPSDYGSTRSLYSNRCRWWSSDSFSLILIFSIPPPPPPSAVKSPLYPMRSHHWASAWCVLWLFKVRLGCHSKSNSLKKLLSFQITDVVKNTQLVCLNSYLVRLRFAWIAVWRLQLFIRRLDTSREFPYAFFSCVIYILILVIFE